MANEKLDDLRIRIGEVVGKHLDRYAERMDFARVDEKLLRDPIFGFQRLRPHEILIIDSPLFQRLRAIFQTSVAFLTYPSSIHTRFEHSINCLHLADKVLTAVHERGVEVSETSRAEVRLAALLHDIGHCIFSHGSEFLYREFPELEQALLDDEIATSSASPSEIVNYCIITSQEFERLLWKPIVRAVQAASGERASACKKYVQNIDLKRVAQRIIGMAPDDRPNFRFETDIVNGPLDVDKLDYLNRDSYFTGVSLAIDIDRLLPSLRVAEVRNQDRNREEHRLVVDHRGIAVVEQLLFARMILYDTVYHHHKVRAATQNLLTMLRRHQKTTAWSTRSKTLASIVDFLEIDEYDFFGVRYPNADLQRQVDALRKRILFRRALVIAPRTVANEKSYAILAGISVDAVNRKDPKAREKARQFLEDLQARALKYARDAGATEISDDDIVLDIPDPPMFTRLGEETFVQFAEGYVVQLKDLFPFQKVVNNYTRQYKYRSYVFGAERWTAEIAYGAFRAMLDLGIQLNDLAFLLAHQHDGRARDLLNRYQLKPLKWREHSYVPDESADSEERRLLESLQAENLALRSRVADLEASQAEVIPSEGPKGGPPDKGSG